VGGISRKPVNPVIAGAVAILAVALAGFLGYRWLNRPEVPTYLYVNAAKIWIEKPEREKLQAQGLAPPEIDRRIQEMWQRGQLKLPPGEPGVDWAGTPNGIVMLPKPDRRQHP
jgi:hypothetical protein